MPVFVDTSAVYAMLDTNDRQHAVARAGWIALADQNETLITSNYVVVETVSMADRRLGLQAVRVFQTDVAPLLQVFWVEEPLHRRAMAALLAAGDRYLSLVDCVSFEVMREIGLDTAFAFDAHFVRQGFRTV